MTTAGNGSAGQAGRMSIVTRMVLLTSAVAVLAVLVAGLVSYPLIHSAAESQTRADLAHLADLTKTALDEGGSYGDGTAPLPRSLVAVLQAEEITGYLAGPAATSGPPGMSSGALAKVLAGMAVSSEGTTDDGAVLIEARPLAGGGAVILEQPFTVVGVEAVDAVRRVAIALLLGLLIAVPVGYGAARRLTRPLRAARDAANEMAAGSRNVTLEPEGPVEIADIADSLNRLNAALVVSEGRQREFLLSVSHELRTPLTAVKGYAEALSDGIIDDDDVQRTGMTVAAEAARLDRLVSDLLDLARLGAVDFHIEPVDVDLVELVEDAGLVWRDRCEPEGVTLRLELPEQPVSLIARTDPIRLRQIVDNLAENALRVSPPGSVIVIGLRVESPWAVVEVRDSGPGLTGADIADAFEPGVLHDRYRGVRPVGTGLGLALVDRLASGLGGSAEAGRSAEGGARFTVRLPLAEPTERVSSPYDG